MATLMTVRPRLILLGGGEELRDAPVEQVAGAVAVDGGDLDGIAEAAARRTRRRPGFVGPTLSHLFTARADGLAAAQQHIGDILIGSGHAGASHP